VFDASNMLYGTLMMGGALPSLTQDGHVRGDFIRQLQAAYASQH
jgi:TRAP-type mannitol/chloroaromatic compound transport system permease small subunit